MKDLEVKGDDREEKVEREREIKKRERRREEYLKFLLSFLPYFHLLCCGISKGPASLMSRR